MLLFPFCSAVVEPMALVPSQSSDALQGGCRVGRGSQGSGCSETGRGFFYL